MDIDKLLQALKDGGYLTAGALNLPASNSLGSAPITALIGNTAYYPNQTLALTLTAMPVVVNGAIPVPGTFAQPFLGVSNASSTVTFTVDGTGTPQLVQTIALPAKWTFAASFPKLKGSAIDGLAFSSASFVLASAAQGAYAAGLNFTGTALRTSTAIATLAWLWDNSAQLGLTGPVTLPADVSTELPTMTLTGAPVATTTSFPAVDFTAGLTAAVDPKATVPAALGLTATIAATGLPALTLTGVLNPDNVTLDLSTGTLAHRLGNLNELAALAGGTAVGNLIPSQFPLGNALSLVSVGASLLLTPESGTLVSIDMAVGLVGMSWTLIPKVELTSIVLGFSLAFPTSQRQLSATIGAVFDIDTAGKPEITLALGLPSLAFTGGLTSGEIDVVSAVSYFFGAQAPAPGDDPLKITQLNFSIDASNKLYSLQATIDSNLKLNLGSDLSTPLLELEQLTFDLEQRSTVFYAALGAALQFLGTSWSVGAQYTGGGTASGWVFTAQLTKPMDLVDIINQVLPATWQLAPPPQFGKPTITSLALTYNTAPKTFAFSGGIAWTLQLTSSLQFGIIGSFAIASSRPSPSAPAQYSGHVRGDISLNGIVLTIEYAFQPNNKQFTAIFQQITGTYDENTTDPEKKGPFVRIAFGNTSVGGILAFLVGLATGGPAKLPSPWDVLNSISLNGLVITIYLNTKSISISYPLSLDLGFIKISKVEFDYKKQYGQGKISLSIDASFFGQDYSGANALKWDPVNESPPAVPSAGSSVFDLEYLGLGQHISLRSSATLDTVDKIIAALESALYPVPDPKGNPLAQLPSLAFDSGSNWLIGARFTIAGTFTMSLVFNDPNVYGLLIQMAGEKAGIFAGLRFEILYRKVTDSIGVYHIDLQLPDAMRHLEFGEVSVTLPNVTLDIYTNGDFRIDVGFPTSLTDFSRCVGVQVFPFVGYGGFYFAKLSGETSSSVPKIDNGRFAPVIEFGIALAVGLGKTLSLGILSGGITITVQGIIEGVYGAFEPADTSLPSATYFHLTGTLSIVGKVWATVDFGIIQASVSLTVYASITITFETYEPLLIEVRAGVSVSVSVKIVFFTIHFSFSATLDESFTIGSRTTPPWHVVTGGGGPSQTVKQLRAQRTAARPRNRVLHANHRRHPRAHELRARGTFAMRSTALSATPAQITLYVTPVITKAVPADLVDPNDNALQPLSGNAEVVAISTMLMVGTSIPPDAKTPEEVRTLTAGASDFNVLLQTVLRWTIASLGTGFPTVTESELEQIANELAGPNAFDQHFAYDQIDAFLAANVSFTLAARPTAGTQQSVAFFPMVPVVALTTPNYSFDFGTQRKIDPSAEDLIAQYFAQLALEYANALERNPSGAPETLRAFVPGAAQESIATFLFRRYFLMLAKSVVQAASDLLKRYPYTIPDSATTTLDAIAAKFSNVTFAYTTKSSDTLASIAQEFDALPAAVQAANPGVDFTKLVPGTPLQIPVQVFVEYVTRRGDTVASVADQFGTTAAAIEAANPGISGDALPAGMRLRIAVEVTPHTIVAANATVPNLLRVWPAGTGQIIPLGQPQQPVFTNVRYQAVDGDTIAADATTGIAQRFGTDATGLMNDNLDAGGLFRPGAQIAFGNLTYTARNGDTLQSIAKFYGLADAQALLDANTATPIVLESTPQQALVIPGETATYTVNAGDTLEAIAAKYPGPPPMTTQQLLVPNKAVRVQAGVTIALPNVVHVATGGPFTVHYATTDGDTADALATYFFGSEDPDKHAAHVTLIEQSNPTVAWPPPAGTIVTFPLDETPGNLLRYYDVQLSVLLSAANVGNKQLLAPRAVFVIPPVAPAIATTDTFATLAQRYNLTLDEVADALGPVTGLFRDADSTGLPQLVIPFVPAIGIEDLIAQIGSSEKANQSAAMASRFLLNGLRIPDPRDPNFIKNPQDPSLATYPLFALTGQEFAAPAPQAKPPPPPPPYDLTLTQTTAAKWLTVPGGALTFPLSADEQQQITDFTTTSFAPNVHRCERLALSAYVPDQRALQTSFHWQAGEMPSLQSSGAVAGEPTLWPLPDALQTSVAHVAASGVPYELEVLTPNPTGGSDAAGVTSARWATTVDLTIAKIPVHGGDAANLPGTFLMLGADQLGTERLLEVMKQLGNDSATLYLLYPPNPSDVNGTGYQSDAFDADDTRADVVLLKTNLSTLSNGTQKFSQVRIDRVAALAAALSGYTATLDPAQSLAFVELLWECSVVKSGGFYLSYQAAGGATFPDRIFDVHGHATLKLVVLFGSQPHVSTSLLLPVNNAVVLGDNVDTSRSTLYARTSVYELVAADTLDVVVTKFPLLTVSPGSLATANATVRGLLRPGATIVVNGANQTIQPLDTFASIGDAATPKVDPATLGTNNHGADMLQPGALIQPLAGELRVEATLRPGNTGFFVTRDEPVQPPGNGRVPGSAQSEVNTLFNLLGFRITPNTWFAASGEGLPAGPTDDTANVWTYRQTFSGASFALPGPLQQVVPLCAALPPPANNPYAGIAAGSQLALTLAFRELDGNRTSFPALAPFLDVGYTDHLLGVERWPSTSCAYAFTPAGGGAALGVNWAFSATSYMPRAGADYSATHDKASADAVKAAAVYYQVRMPDTCFTLDTSIASVDGDPVALSAAMKLALQDYVGSAYVFLTQAQAVPQVTATTSSGTPDTLNSVAETFETAPGTVAHANAVAQPAQLFASTTLSIPQYYRVVTGDTMTAIAKKLLPNGSAADRLALIKTIAAANAAQPLLAGTAVIAAARPVTVDNTNVNLASVASVAASQHVAVADLPPVGGFANANTTATLTQDNVLAYEDAPPLTVGANQTLADVVALFAKSVPGATAPGVAINNQFVQSFFANATVLQLPNYVLQPDDTLTSVGNYPGPLSPGNDDPPVRLLVDNADVPNVFPPGTSLFYGLTSYSIQSGDTLQSVADGFAITVEDLGARNALLSLTGGQTLKIPFLVDSSGVSASTYRADGTETFAGIVAKFSAWQSDPAAGLSAFAALNRYVPALFDTTKAITIGGTSVTPTTKCTFDLLATAFGMGVDQFAAQIASTSGYVRAGATMYATAMTAAAGETLTDVATRYNATLGELAEANASVYQLLAAGPTVAVGGFQATVGKADTFTSLAARINLARTTAQTPQAPTVTAADVANGVWTPALTLGAATLLPPVRGAATAVGVTPRYDAAIAPVHVTVTFKRDETLVDPEFTSSQPVCSATTPVTALPFAPGGGDAVDPLFSLQQFAADFEKAFAGFKLATGADADYAAGAERAACGSVVSTRSRRMTATAAPAAAGDPDPLSNRQLWCVNLGKNGPQSARFNYVVDRHDVMFYGIPPLSTALWDSGDLTVQTYVSGTGLGPSVVRRFRATEPDQWASTFLSAIDDLLAPAAAVALNRTNPAWLTSIIDAKNALAAQIKTELIPIFQLPQSPGTTQSGDAQEALYQQLLVQLGSAYATNVLVQYPFTVASGCTDPEVAARLSGKPVAPVYRTAVTPPVNVPDVATALGVSLPYLVGTSAADLGVISATPFIVLPNVPTSFGGKQYTTSNDDTLASIAAFYGVTVLQLLAGIDTGGKGLLRTDTAINVSKTVRTIGAGTTSLLAIAGSVGGTIIELAQANSGVKNVFVPQSTIALPGFPSATVPADGSFAAVAQALATDLAGLATALWTADVTGAGGYTLDSTVLTVLRVPPPYTFSVAKLPLASGTQYATYLFDVKDVNLNRAVFLDLEYAITEMEYDIVEDKNALGAYQASSWLAFVLPITADDTAVFPNDGYLGPVQIPLPLRAYPQPFVLADSAARFPLRTAGGTDDALFDWSYGFGATRMMAAQDSAELDVAFNVSDAAQGPVAGTPPPRTALFQALAAFAFVYPEIAKDLAQLTLPAPNAGTVSGAVTAFITLATAVVTAWQQPPFLGDAVGDGSGDLYTFAIDTIVNETAQDRYQYLQLTALEGPDDFAFTLPPACATDLDAGKLDSVRTPFAGAGYPLSNDARVQQPYASPWTVVDATNTFTLTLTPDKSNIVVARHYLWPALTTPAFTLDAKYAPDLTKDDLTGVIPLFSAARYPLGANSTSAVGPNDGQWTLDDPANDRSFLLTQTGTAIAVALNNEAQQIGSSMLYDFAQTIDTPANLQFTFENMQLLGKQNAIAGLAVTRNADLVAGQTTANDFVYTTPMVAFPSATNPYSIRSEEVDLTKYLVGGKGLAAALTGFLNTVYTSLILSAPATQSQIALIATYTYTLSAVPGTDAISASFPLALVPQYEYPVATGAAFVQQFADFVETQATVAGVTPGVGNYTFELTIFSSLGNGSANRPLLKFENLVFPLSAS